MLRTAACLVAAALLAGCGGGGTPAPEEPAQDLFLPAGAGRVPLVLLVPGGGWTTADPAGLTGLAEHLADAGVASRLAHIRAAEDGVRFPVPVEDVLCEVAAAVAETKAEGFDPDPVVVLGHSSGAHLAALAVLATDDYSPDCDDPAVRPDALVGLSGPYDIAKVPDTAVALLGSDPDRDPVVWESANPIRRAGLRPAVPVLLLHGDGDDLVPLDFTSAFAEALELGGHPTAVEVVPGADHHEVYRGDVAGPLVLAWLDSLSSSRRAPAA